MEEVGADAYKKWTIDHFMEKYKTLEKFLVAQLKADRDTSWYFESARDSMIQMYKACAAKDGLFSIEEILWKKVLKRLWGVLSLEVLVKEEAFKKTEGKSVQAWTEFEKTTDMHFETLKNVFSSIYRDLNPLVTDLKFENSLRALTA